MPLPPLGHGGSPAGSTLPGTQGGLSDRLDPVRTKAGRPRPAWPRPTVPRVDAKGPMIQNGQLTFARTPMSWVALSSP